MKRGARTHYPYVTDGSGKGIIEDISPYEVAAKVEKTGNEYLGEFGITGRGYLRKGEK